MNLKTLHLTNAWHASSGGIATFYRALMQGAERWKRPMRLVVPGEKDAVEELGEFTKVLYVQARHAPWNKEYRMLYPDLYLRPDGPILKILREERPDVVEINDKYTLNYLGGLLRERWAKGVDWRPTVVGLSCERMDENMAAYLSKSAGAARFTKAYMKWLYFPMCDHHIAVSEHTAAELAVASRGHKVRRGVWSGPMGVDHQLFSSAKRSDRGRADLIERTGGQWLLLYAGRLAREKNLGLLLEMMAALPGEYRLLIAGMGEERSRLEAEAAQRLPGRVVFLGHVQGREALADLYAKVDMFVHPNPKEPFGIAPLEAMAAGLPLLVPDTGGVTAYASIENAWMGPAEGRLFAEQAISVVTDLADRERRVARARQTAVSFSWEAATDRYMRLYEEIHLLTRGAKAEPAIPPMFYSSAGNYWGREGEFEVSSQAAR